MAVRAIALVAVAGAFVVLLPLAAQAHAAIVSSEPQAGSELTAAPGVVTVRFTEPLNAGLSRASVTDPNGQRFEGAPSGAPEIRIILRTNAPGVYRVDWVTVSTVDGHTLRGAFRFGVGVAPGEGAEGSVNLTPQPFDLAVGVARFVEDAALLTAIGMLFVAALARRRPTLDWVRPRLRPALGLAFAAGLLVVTGEALAASQDPSPRVVWTYLATGSAGLSRLARITTEALGLVLATIAPRRVGPVVLASVVSLAWAGHAAAVRPSWVGIATDAGHLLAAGLWAGGIMAMALARPPGGWRGSEGRELLSRFSPMAVPAFLATIGFGALRGVQELDGWADLLTTPYGRVLSAKVAVVLAMIPLSVLAWRRLVGSLRAEAVLAGLAIAAAALLAAYPLPPARVAEAEEAAATEPGARAFPSEGDLTLGGHAGEFLIGLTLRPGEPGANRLLLYVLPLGGPEEASRVQARLFVGGTSVATRRCSPTCSTAEVRLEGRERVTVRVEGRGGGTATFAIPPLPAPGGADLFRRMQDRMHDLITFRLEELLRPAEPPLRASYAFQAPDRMRLALSTGAENVLVGRTRYSREGPSSAWRREPALPLKVPSYIWDGRRLVAPAVLGAARVDGMRTEILSFFGPSGSTPIWFRLWVDATGLVRRAEMRAQGHFMDHRYFAFDEPIEIRPPPL